MNKSSNPPRRLGPLRSGTGGASSSGLSPFLQRDGKLLAQLAAALQQRSTRFGLPRSLTATESSSSTSLLPDPSGWRREAFKRYGRERASSGAVSEHFDSGPPWWASQCLTEQGNLLRSPTETEGARRENGLTTTGSLSSASSQPFTHSRNMRRRTLLWTSRGPPSALPRSGADSCGCGLLDLTPPSPVGSRHEWMLGDKPHSTLACVDWLLRRLGRMPARLGGSKRAKLARPRRISWRPLALLPLRSPGPSAPLWLPLRRR